MSGKEQTSARSDSIWAAIVLGLPLSAGVLAFMQQACFQGTLAGRYVEHPIEQIEIVEPMIRPEAFLGRLGLFQLRGVFEQA